MKHALLTAMVLLTGTAGLSAATLKDAESATHGYDAARYQVVNTYEYPGFKLIQFNLASLSHYSYMLVSDGQALVVDPGRDIQAYLDTARQQNLKIIGLYLTHSHADFVAGHTEMVKATGCPIYQSDKSKAEYKIEPAHEGTTIQVGQATVKSIETPGHVVDGTSALVYAKGRDRPELILTGDYLFVGSVGRPDLVVGTTAAALAGMAFDTWQIKVSKLPDGVLVFPAHGAGSLCGAHLRDSPHSTIGEERASNPYLQHKAKSEFVTAVLSDLSEPPQYFGHNAALNRKGPDLVNWDQPLTTRLSPSAELTDSARYYVVDIRDAKDYAAGHIPNSVNIALRGRLETWVGIMVPWGSNLVICGETDDIKEALHRLHRVGYTGPYVLFSDWQKASLAANKNDLMLPEQLHAAMQAGTEPLILDVRLPNEWMGLRIGTVLNLPLNKLSELSAKLNPNEPVVAVCNSAYRSTMAIGVLERKGFTKVTSLAGGSEAWIAAGYPVYGAESKTATASAPKRVVPLPERICAAELNRLMLDLPGTYDLVDIRPPEMFADYSLPGAVNVDLADLIGNPAWLTGAGPLIIVDRDGSLAMVAAGILSQKTQRQIKAVFGGLDAYWSQTQSGAPPTPAPAAPTVTPSRATPPTAPAPAAPARPAPPAKKSAGC
ncbi:MAG: MBL fold metallo-hydrolase [Sedimentisphaerales bacterium]|nr:MBL fold metallo-hydrolase [Sedimentisphaerales bacterium]